MQEGPFWKKGSSFQTHSTLPVAAAATTTTDEKLAVFAGSNSHKTFERNGILNIVNFKHFENK